MPIATPEVYAAMIDAAKKGSFAYPAINVSSSQTLNAALQGFTGNPTNAGPFWNVHAWSLGGGSGATAAPRP